MKLGSDIKVVWIASAPRCGSMWIFNVTRQIVREAGLQALPAPVPQSDSAMMAAAQEGLHDLQTDRVRVVKVHALLRSDTPRSSFILPRRDVRDRMISYMRFMRCDFEMGLEFARAAIAADRYYDAFPRERALFVDYVDIGVRPAEVAQAVAKFLEVPLPRQATNAIARDLAKAKVARLIEKKERDLAGRRKEGRAIGAAEVVVLGRGNVRAFDPETGFQSGHVSNYQEGDWKRVLTTEQKSRLEQLISAT
jgi:sulfotransferase family protein